MFERRERIAKSGFLDETQKKLEISPSFLFAE
jgi:hypothetical protein